MSGPKVLNLKRLGGVVPDGAVLIDRRTKWGNPFRVTAAQPREKAIEKYRKHLLSNGGLVREAKAELRGRDLACWCYPEACHGDVLLEIANK